MIKCLICGKEFKQLNSHLRKHEITLEEYCKKYNVKSTLSDESRNNISKATKAGMNYEVIQKMKDNWLSDKRKEFLSRKSTAMMGNIPGNRLTNEQFVEKLNTLFPNKFRLLSDYTGASKSVKLHCNDCNTDICRIPNYIYSHGCSNCNKLNKVSRVNTWNKISSEEFKKRFNEKIIGYELLSEYTKAEDKIHVRHTLCGHDWWVTARQIYSNESRCPLCAKRISNKEIRLQDFIKRVYSGTVEVSVRNVISPYELDVYIPEKKLAIEFNGTYWHSSLYKDKKYHFNKSQKCEEKGIRLIHIWEYEWDNERQRPILENIIKNALGVNENKVYARKLDIEIRPSREMREFFDKNNIQGFRSGKFSICLVDKKTRVVYMAYQMGHCYFGKGKYKWEVIRGATKLGYTVVGGASKIWKYFIDNYNPQSCVYYVDYNYFNGNSLPYLGLQYITTQSSFKNLWVETSEVRNREPSRHKEIKELQEKGLVIPVYNAGTKVYTYNKK